MNRFRHWIRRVFGLAAEREVDDLRLAIGLLKQSVDKLTEELQYEQEWRKELTGQLREKAKSVKRYTDWENSQVAALESFKEDS